MNKLRNYNIYHDINPRIRNFILQKMEWSDFSLIQKKAFPIINSNINTLVIAPTASGKTESVLIPVFNHILNEKLEPMSVLYIAPLKALINDMDSRIEDWCEYFDLTQTKWHGDVTQTQRKKFLKKPTDFLLITPESLEVILMNKSNKEKHEVFKNLKYVIIDEIHNFIENDRGMQLNSLLNRIQEYTRNNIIKLGLSATIGNPEEVSKWLDPQNPAMIVKDEQKNDFFYYVTCANEIEIIKSLKPYKNKQKILIFTLQRAEVERYKQLLSKQLNYENILVHHSSINKEERETNEEQFKKMHDGFMISTNTLELGIDIGNIYLVALINPPFSVSSLMQKIGRSGRKKNIHSKTIIFCKSPVNIFITLAEISLAKKGQIENIKINKKPYDIYFHQILSSIKSKGKIDIKELYYYLHTCYVFDKITPQEYMKIIKHMVTENFLEKRDYNLYQGVKFVEKFGKFNYMNFPVVFCPSNSFKVYNNKKEIGELDPTFALMLKTGDKFTLAGQNWQITKRNETKFTIHVTKDKNNTGVIPNWSAGGPSLSYTITQEIYKILLNDYNPELLNNQNSEFTDQLIKTIQKHIKDSQKNNFQKDTIPIEIDSNGSIYIYTFAGDKANQLLSLIFKLHYKISSANNTPFYTSFHIKEDYTYNEIESIIYNVKNILTKPENRQEICQLLGKYYKNKFINYLPEEFQTELKFQILFDEESLIKICENKQPIRIGESIIKYWGLSNKDEEKEEEKNI